MLIVAATNRPDLLDTALVDRFDVLVPFIRPGKADLIEITAIMLKRNGRRLGEIKAVSIAETLEGLSLTGRNLEAILVRAGHIADAEAGCENQPIRLKHFKQAAREYIPRLSDLWMEFLEQMALNMCDHKPLLPCSGPDGLLNIPGHLQRFFLKNGSLDKVELNKSLNQLKGTLQTGRMVA